MRRRREKIMTTNHDRLGLNSYHPPNTEHAGVVVHMEERDLLVVLREDLRVLRIKEEGRWR